MYDTYERGKRSIYYYSYYIVRLPTAILYNCANNMVEHTHIQYYPLVVVSVIDVSGVVA